MNEKEPANGGIESVKSIWDVNTVEREYYDEDGEHVSPKEYNGDGEVVYTRGLLPSHIEEMVGTLPELRAEREDYLIYTLSRLYGKRDGKYLSRVLERVENDEEGWYNKQYSVNYGKTGYDYLRYLREHDSEQHDEDFYRFAQWYDYAFRRYAREVFLPKARRHETEYAEKIRAKIKSGLLPTSAETKLESFDTHTVKYILVDAFNEQDVGGRCSRSLSDGSDSGTITYHAEFGLDENDELPNNYGQRGSDFAQVLDHESTHLLFNDLFGLYSMDLEERMKMERSIKKEGLGSEQIDIMREADRIVTEGAVEWITQILNQETNEDKAETECGTYQAERQVLDSLLNDGVQKIDARELFALCANGKEKLEINRKRFFDSLFLAYPDCSSKLDIAKRIVERFYWFEWQDSEKNQ